MHNYFLAIVSILSILKITYLNFSELIQVYHYTH